MDADGSNVERLSDGAGLEGPGDWSPNGRSIVFVSSRDGDFDIYRMRADGQDVRKLTDHPGTDTDPFWRAAADGRRR